MPSFLPARRKPLDEVIGEIDSLRSAAQHASARSVELRQNAVVLNRQMVVARLLSRRDCHYARVVGEVEGAAVLAVVRRNGIVAGERPLLNRMDVAAPLRDPLLTTLQIARACDTVLTVGFTRAGARPHIPDIGVTARAGNPTDDSWIEGMALGEYFSMEVEENEGTHVVRLHGELDLVNAERVRDTLIQVAGSTTVADVSELTFIDARGLAAFVAAKAQITANGHVLEVIGAKPFVRRVFQIGELGGLIDD